MGDELLLDAELNGPSEWPEENGDGVGEGLTEIVCTRTTLEPGRVEEPGGRAREPKAAFTGMSRPADNVTSVLSDLMSIFSAFSVLTREGATRCVRPIGGSAGEELRLGRQREGSVRSVLTEGDSTCSLFTRAPFAGEPRGRANVLEADPSIACAGFVAR